MSEKKTSRKNYAKEQTEIALTPNRALLSWLSILVIVLITFISFFPSLKNDFTNWDDPAYVLENKLVVNNSLQMKEIFTTPVEANYHPLTMLSLALNYQTSKLDPKEYHEWNLLLHLINTLLVFFFIYLLTRRNLLMASIVALFFGIHPMHVESVAWISERKDLLYVFFFLAGLITYLKYKETKRLTWYCFTLFLFTCSCLSKGMAVVFPVILFLIDYLQTQDTKLPDKVRAGKTQEFLLKIPFFILSTGFGIAAYHFQQQGLSTDVYRYNIGYRVLFATYGAIMYLVKFFIPSGLSAFYPYPSLNRVIPTMIWYPFILIILIVLVCFFLRKDKSVVFGLLFYFVSVAFVLQFITIGSEILAERYSYLAYIGLLFPVAYIINKAWQEKNSFITRFKYPLTLLMITVACVFFYQTYARTQVWKNSETLWTDVINNYPHLYRAYENRGEYYQDKEEYEKAFADFSKAIQFFPYDAEAFNNRGMIYYRQGRNDLALADFNNAIKYNTEKNEASSAYGNRANVYLRMGENDNADKDFAKAFALDSQALQSHFATLLVLRGNYYDKTNQYEKALADYTRYLTLKPGDDVIYNYRGLCYVKLNRINDAFFDFAKAIQLNPSVPNYWLNRSFAENTLGNKADAKADALKAEELGMPVDTNYLKAL